MLNMHLQPKQIRNDESGPIDKQQPMTTAEAADSIGARVGADAIAAALRIAVGNVDRDES